MVSASKFEVLLMNSVLIIEPRGQFVCFRMLMTAGTIYLLFSAPLLLLWQRTRYFLSDVVVCRELVCTNFEDGVG